MCGIVGYVGDKQARGVVIEGLRRLEYRGYDSAGIAVVTDGSIAWDKRAGKLANLEKAEVCGVQGSDDVVSINYNIERGGAWLYPYPMPVS